MSVLKSYTNPVYFNFRFSNCSQVVHAVAHAVDPFFQRLQRVFLLLGEKKRDIEMEGRLTPCIWRVKRGGTISWFRGKRPGDNLKNKRLGLAQGKVNFNYAVQVFGLAENHIDLVKWVGLKS